MTLRLSMDQLRAWKTCLGRTPRTRMMMIMMQRMDIVCRACFLSSAVVSGWFRSPYPPSIHVSFHSRSASDASRTGNWMELPPAERPSEQTKLRVCRLPAAVSYIPRGFNPKHFSEADDEDALAQKQKPRASETLIRWRFRRNAGGEIERDSHGRPVVRPCSCPSRWLVIAADSFVLQSLL